MMRFAVAVSLLMGVFLVAPSQAQEKKQAVEGNVLKDLQYGFALTRPTASWQFLEEDRAKKINVEAVAGMINGAGRAYVLVIPEKVPGGEIDAYTDLILGNMALEDKKVVKRDAVESGGHEGRRVEVRGKANGLEFVFKLTILQRGDFFYQLATWWLAAMGRVKPAEIDAIHEKFSLLQNVSPEVRAHKTANALSGLGWQVEGNLYEHGIYGFAYRLPSPHFRFMAGPELREINADASMGLVNASAGLYTVVIAEKLGDLDMAAYEKLILDRFAQSNEYASVTQREVEFGSGKAVERHFHEVSLGGTMKADYFLAVTVSNGVGCQIMSWCLHGRVDGGMEAAAEVPGGFSWISVDRRMELLPKLRAQADALKSVTRGECFRNRRYRNFGCGFSLTLPEGFWNHAIGAGARSDNPDASLLFTSLDHDLNGVLVVEEAEGLSAEEYHGLLRMSLETPKETAVRTVDVNGLAVRSSRWTEQTMGQAFTYHVISARAGVTHVQLVLHGFAKNLEHTADLEDLILRSFTFSGKIEPWEEFLGNGAYVNHAVGFRIDPPDPSWKASSITPPVMRGLGGLIRLSKPGTQENCHLGGVHSGSDIEELIANLIENSPIFKSAGMKRIVEISVVWLGKPARKITYLATRPGADFELEALITTVGGTQYFLMAAGEKGSNPWETFKKCLKRIE